jgi:hypothetical protein
VHPGPLEKNTNSAKCIECHEDKSKGKAVHSAIQLGCTTCHEIRVIKDITRVKLKATTPLNLCLSCHTDKNAAEINGPVHKPVILDCLKCHDLNQVLANSSLTEHARHVNDGFLLFCLSYLPRNGWHQREHLWGKARQFRHQRGRPQRNKPGFLFTRHQFLHPQLPQPPAWTAYGLNSHKNQKLNIPRLDLDNVLLEALPADAALYKAVAGHETRFPRIKSSSTVENGKSEEPRQYASSCFQNRFERTQ